MIHERDLDEAIAECQGQRNPGTNTCIKLAAYYIIKDHLYPSQDVTDMPVAHGYSHASGPTDYDSGTEFSEAIRGLDPADLLPVIDELMDAVRVLNPRLYNGVMRKIRDM